MHRDIITPTQNDPTLESVNVSEDNKSTAISYEL